MAALIARREVITLLGGAAAACQSWRGLRNQSACGTSDGCRLAPVQASSRGASFKACMTAAMSMARTLLSTIAGRGVSRNYCRNLMAAKQATSTIPIVFSSAGAPIEKGLVSSLSHPGGNITGLALITDGIKPLAILNRDNV